MALLSDDDVFGAQKPAGLLSDDDVFGTASQDNPLTRGYKHAVSSAKTAKAMVTGDYPEAARLASERDAYAKRNPGSKEGNELMKAWDSGDGIIGGIKGVAGEVAKDWREAPSTFDAVRATGKNLLAMGGGIVEQVPNMVMPMAGMVAGGAAGGASPIPGGTAAGAIAGATLGNAATESAEQVDRSLRDAGIDPQDTGAVQAYLEQNGGKIVGQTLTKGAVLGAVDTATAGLAHRLLTAPAKAATRRALAGMGVDAADKAAVKTAMESAEFGTRIANDAAYHAAQKGVSKAARNAGAFALEPAGEFAGEYFGQGLATGDWDTKGAALEALSSMGQSGITFAGQKFIEYVTRPKSGASTDALTEPPTGSLLALPSPTYTGTPSDQVLQGQVERQRMIDEADANAQAVYEARAAFEAAQRELNAIQLTTDPEPLQQRIDELLGIGRKPLPKGEQAAYEKALADALNEPVGITHDSNGMEIPLTMGAYLDARTEAADKQRMLDAAETMTAAGEAAQARLSQVQDEESAVQPEIPVVGPLSAAAKQAVDSGVAANIQARKALEEAPNPIDGGEKNGNQSRQPANAEMAAPGAQGAGSNLPGGGSILAPASAGNAGTGVNRAEVAASSVRPAVPAGTPVDAGLVRSYKIGQATMLANRLTRQGMPSEIYPHPTQAGMFAIRPQGQPAAESVEQPSPTAAPATQRNSARRMTPIMRRDDLVGAIMRVTGGNGIAASMADTLTGEKANAATKLRGLFTSQGQADMDDLAMLLREEEGFDVRDASHLEDLIREAAAGNVARSMARQERDAQEDQDKQYRDQIRARAKKYGIKTVAVKFSELEKIVLQRLEDRHNQAVAQLDDRSQQRFNTALEDAMALVPEEVVDETLADVSRRGLHARDFWNEATRILRGMIYDAKQEASNGTEQPTEEIGDGRGNSGTGRGTAADQRDQAPAGQADERAAEPAEEERPGLALEGQTLAEVRAQEAQRQAEEARANRPEPDTSPKVKADQVDLFNTQGGLFNSNRDSQSTIADLPSVDTASAPVASTEQAQPGKSLNNEETIFVRKGDRFKDGQGKEYEVWNARSSLIEAFPIVNGKMVVSNETGVRFATDARARFANPEARTDFFPIETKKKIVTPQLMTQAQFNSVIQIAADSITKLRRIDVDRVLQSTPEAWRLDMAGRIKDARPDLAQEVDSVMAEEAKSPVDTAAHEAATSPQNDTPEPSQAQKEAGNYKVGRVQTIQTKQTENGIALQEESAVYTVNEPDPISGDLFQGTENALPAAAGKNSLRPKPGTAVDRSSPRAVLAVREAPDTEGLYNVQAQLVTVGERRLPVDSVNSPEDAARAFAHLSRFAVEHMDGLVTDKNGKPLAVIGALKGAPTQASIYPSTILMELSRIDGAANLWLSHNHPSGRPDLSAADMMIAESFGKILRGTNITFRGVSAMARTGNVVNWSDSDYNNGSVDANEPAPHRVAIVEREIVESNPGAQISSPSDAKRLVAEIAKDRPGVLFTTAQNAVASFVPFEPSEMGELRSGDRLMRLFRAAARSGGTGAFVAMPDGRVLGSEFSNIKGALSTIDVRVLDGIEYSSDGSGKAESLAEKGLDISSGASFYNQANDGRITPADKAIYGMAAEGKSATEILQFIASTSRSPFNRQVAKLLQKTGIATTITVGDSKGWKFNAGEGKYAAAYNPKTDTAALFRPAAAERNILHELVHAATLNALGKRGLAAVQMKKLFEHVQQSGRLKGQYGMTNVDEFVSEAFTNPKFQQALKAVSAPAGSTGLKSAWHWFVRVVRGILGIPQGQENALSRALELGVEVMRENMALPNSGNGKVRYANGNAQTDSDAFRKWFGDSKVVDKNGDPLVVYHWTDNDFNAFDISISAEGAHFGTRRAATDRARGMADIGYEIEEEDGQYFVVADSGQKADEWQGPFANKKEAISFRAQQPKKIEPMALYLSIKNPVRLPDLGTWNAWDIVRALPEGTLTSAEKSSIMDASDRYHALRETLIANGVDGIVYRNEVEDKGKDSYIAFRPEQIKSAIGNSGDFDASNPDIRYNVADDGWAVSAPSKMDDVIYALQDKHIDTKRVIEGIRATGKKIADTIDPYLQEELFHGRAAKGVKDFLDMELRPLLAEMQKASVDMGDFEEYLWNRHAEERNAQIAKINPEMKDGGSGIKTADAKAYLAGLPAERRATFEQLASRIDAINRNSQGILVSSGLEKQETIDAWNGAYKHYVPLQREDVDSGHVGTGKGFSIRGSSSKRAMGSGRNVVDIIANITMQRERNIVRAEKNRVSNALMGLAMDAPNEGFWQVDKAPKERTVTEKAIYTVRDADGKKLDEFTRMVDAEKALKNVPDGSIDQTWGDRVEERVVPGFTSRDNVVLTRVNGEDHYIIFNERNERAMRMAAALKNLDADNLGRVLSVVGKATRYLASINTQYNPVFGVINLIRDAQGALLNLSSTPLAGDQKRVLGYTKDALVGIYKDIRAHRAGKKPSSNWADLFEEFQREGGQTGYRDQYANAEQRAEAIRSELKQFSEGKAKQLTRGVFGWLSDYNETMENAVRLAAYKAAKEKGISNQQAASIAKNITVNFNRKGQMATQVGALYAFFNASVQGTARIAETLFEPNNGDLKSVRLSKIGKRIITGGIMLGSMQAMLLAAAGYDDDEPPDFVRERNLILPIGDGKYLTLAMPLGFHVLPGIGRVVTEFVLSGGKQPMKQLAALSSMFADTFNPIGNAGFSLQTITPSVVDPFAALAENKDFTGKEIYRENFNSLNPQTGNARAKDVATFYSKMISASLNWITGGSEFRPGLLSPSPDAIDYLIGQVTGGVGREANKVFQTGDAIYSGEDLPLHKVPLVGRFIGDAQGQSGQSQRFYEGVRQLNILEAEYKGLLKSGRRQEAAEFMAENPGVRLIMMGNYTENQVRKLREQKRALVKNDAPTEEVKSVDQRIMDTMRKFNERVSSVM